MQVRFAGVPAVLQSSLTMRQGVRPSTGRIAFAAGYTPPMYGDLWLSDDSNAVWLRNMYLLDPVESQSDGGHIIQATLVDRRAWWRYGVVSGRYNVPDEATGVPSQQRTLRQLLDLCFGAYSETPIYYDIPVVYPAVIWELESPANAIQELCDKYALGVSLMLDGSVVVAPLYMPRGFPSGPQMEREVTYLSRLLPASVNIMGNRIINQTTYTCVPVGVESSDQADAGAIKPIDDLSYTPADGWGKAILREFSDVAAGEKRILAEHTVFRWYGWLPTNVGTDTREAKLPWLNHIKDTEAVVDSAGLLDENKRSSPQVWTEQSETDGITIRNKSLSLTPTPYKLDHTRGIVKFDQPVFKVPSTGQAMTTVSAATVQVVAAHEMNTGDGVYYSDYYRYSVLLGGPLPPMVKHDPSLTLYAENGTADPTQKAAMDLVAMAQAAEIVESLNQFNPRQAAYAGIVPYDVYGDCKSVTYELSPQGIQTIISMGREEIRRHIPSYEERLQTAKTAALHWPSEVALQRNRQEREIYRQ